MTNSKTRKEEIITLCDAHSAEITSDYKAHGNLYHSSDCRDQAYSQKEACHDSINLSVKVCRNCGIISLMIGHIVYRYAFLKDGIFTIDDGDRIDMMDLLDGELENTFSRMIEKYLEDSLETIQYMGDIDEW